MFRRLTAALALSVGLAGIASPQGTVEREGGIVGTGIVGTIEDLGSIYVDGMWIETPEDLPVESWLGASPASGLRIGDVVAATVTYDDGWTATHLQRVLPIMGPVTDVGDGTLTVLGTPVNPGPGVDIEGIAVGDWVAVSGLCRIDGVIATRIERIEPRAQAAMIGNVLTFDETGTLVIGGTRITGDVPADLELGTAVKVMGTADGSELIAESVQAGIFDTDPRVIRAQGYFSAPLPSGLYTMLGTTAVGFAEDMVVETEARTSTCSVDGVIQGTAVDLDPSVQETLDLLGCSRVP